MIDLFALDRSKNGNVFIRTNINDDDVCFKKMLNVYDDKINVRFVQKVKLW